MRIAIIGFGREGRSVLKYLENDPVYKRAEVFILDKNQTLDTYLLTGRRQLSKFVAGKILGPDYLKNLNSFDLVFRSPGVAYNLPEIQNAIKNGVKFTSATKLFFEKCPALIIGVTGTKGKGTTSTLIYKILKNAGKDAYLLGNIGKPAIEALPKLKKNSIVVFELSSFQLQDLEASPGIAIVLDIFPDHMDSHSSFEEYVHSKASIAKYQNKNQHIFYFENNNHSKTIGLQGAGVKHAISVSNFSLFLQKDLKIPGEHNFKNAGMAATIAIHLKIPKSIIIKTVKSYKGLEHRLEFVRTIKKINFYNDSGGTNPHTAAAAVGAFKEPIILISGGKDKNLDYTPLAKTIRESKNVIAVILFGENKNKIADYLKNTADIKVADDLKSAVILAYELAKKLMAGRKRLITTIFSPGAASFDMFKDYADRGNRFKKIVKALK